MAELMHHLLTGETPAALTVAPAGSSGLRQP
ncbi:hypothetical protein PHG260 (plasmid) [Cupriavidus necator H16]|uniref:Uncharacterized protein n=1 Tax=Cupriavidus necator (strain ATCC 17699 / DSM 428 / KCTC 22496 / NCIMB 10442 / H16 / Stanier 337) TaxID=381666 RepID=Q7WX82_CUPNH|nr:hypothetical protein PHG260 [Cupriavidus necator H16]